MYYGFGEETVPFQQCQENALLRTCPSGGASVHFHLGCSQVLLSRPGEIDCSQVVLQHFVKGAQQREHLCDWVLER